ncbi:ATPase, T2SS/T4P/T4SS family, partial [Erwinia sp.]|uniref:type IV pilus twitching motility protein PilT n=1 Tax=Erwinia citreus TaxID=558 RepID=UPI00289ADBC0
MDIEELVALSVKHNAGDLHLCSGHSPFWRLAGRLEAVPGGLPESDGLLQNITQSWLNADQQREFGHAGQLDFALTLADGTRLRANLFRQRQGVSLALRFIASRCPGMAELALPPVAIELLQLQDGLVLVTGATGSGKSTTLAALIGAINQQQHRHILTLEDPVEFIHRSECSLIQQREIGQHCASFSAGLRAALRQDPDV